MKINSKWTVGSDPKEELQLITTCPGAPPPSTECSDAHAASVAAAQALDGQAPLLGTATSTWWEPPA